MKIQLSKQEVEALQEKIVREHWFPVDEQLSYSIYQATYEIEGDLYVFYKDLDQEMKQPIVKRSE